MDATQKRILQIPCEAEKSIYDSVDDYQALGVIESYINADDVKKQIWVPLDIEGI